jgi:hypothetical protein
MLWAITRLVKPAQLLRQDKRTSTKRSSIGVRNGIFRARLVACGYSQIPGVDFQESYAPVINDVTFRILLGHNVNLEFKRKSDQH